MSNVQLDDRLGSDTYVLGRIGSTCLLLSRNALFPWFILVPDTNETEFYKLTGKQQAHVLELINNLSRFIKKSFSVDKLNVATIGNVVSQLHIHIVGRSRNDPCWPDVVWGCSESGAYAEEDVVRIRHLLKQAFPSEFESG